MTKLGRARRAVGGAVGLICLTITSAASAQPTTTRAATVVRIDGDDVFIDVGASRAPRGAVLDVFRSIEVRHPVTRQPLRDRFLVGRVQVLQAGETLGVARIVGTPWRPLQVGDEVRGDRPEPVAPTPQEGPVAVPSTAVAAPDAQTQELLRVWLATLGRSPTERVALYRTFVARNPGFPRRSFVEAEIAALEQWTTSQREQIVIAAPPPPEPDPDALLRERVVHAALGSAMHGDPLDVALLLRPGVPVRALMLYVRARGETQYESRRMSLDARGHAIARIPQRFVMPPGFDYFVDVVDERGRMFPVVRSAEEPVRVDVSVPEGVPDPSEHRARVRFSVEAVSFHNMDARDAYIVTEGDYLYRTLYDVLYGVRVGYGVLRGQGGTTDDLDMRGLDPQAAGFTYGYTEMELRISDLFAAIARIEIGLGRPESSDIERNGLTGGFQLRLRIGPERGTHFLLAGETVPEIGQLASIALHWEVIENFPMQAEVHVTDQPVNSGELAVRGVYELGYRTSDTLAFALRLSYQGRNIKHAGPGVGLAMTFDW